MYRDLLRKASALYIQKFGGLAYALTEKGLNISTPLIIIYKRFYDIEKMRVLFIDGLAVEGEIIPYETYFVMNDYVILV